MNILLVFLLLFRLCSPKTLRSSFNIMRFNSHSFQFLLKQTLGVGEGTFKIKAHFTSPISHPSPPSAIQLQLHFFTDLRWSKAQFLEDCQDKVQKANDFQPLPLPVTGAWGPQIELALNQSKRPFIWYVFLTDCEKVLPQYTDSRNMLEFELEMVGPGGSQIPYEYEGKIPLNLGVILGYILLLIALKLKFRLLKRDSEDFFAKPPVYFVLAAMGFEVLALGFETAHIAQMAKDGTGFYLCGVFYLLFSVISQFSLVLLCVLLASGWSLTRKRIDDWEMYIPLFSVIGLFEILLISLDRALFDNSYALHDYEGLAMAFILGIRVIFWVNLMFLLGKMVLEVRESGGHAMLEQFVMNFAGMVSLFALGLPAVVVATNWWVPEYFRHRFLGICSLGIQFITIAGFLIMFDDGDSLYNKVRVKKKSSQNLPVSLKKD